MAETQAGAAEMELPEALRAFLVKLGARETDHGTRNLFVHLTGTAALLARWGNPEPVWVAGMFHSIYGTSAFSKARIGHEGRPYVASVIGAEAEELTYLFSEITPDELIARAYAVHKGRQDAARMTIKGHPVSWAQLCRLLEISVANVIEQAAELRARGKEPQDYLRGQVSCQNLLSEACRRALLAFMQA